jgi:hypothetical protein
MFDSESFETTTRVVTSTLILYDAPAPPPDEWERWQDIQSIYWRDQLRQRIDSRSQTPATGLSASGLLRVWNGACSSQLVDGDTGISITGRAAPGDWDNQGFLFDQVIGRYPTWVELPELLSTGTILEAIEVSDILRVKFHPAASDTMVFELELETEPTVRLRRVFREFTRDEPTALINRQEFVIDEWRDFDGLMLPARARLIASEFGREGFEGHWIKTITYYERLGARRLNESPADDLFTIPYKDGMGVHDERLNFSFAVGSRNFYYDGAAYSAPEPLMEHPHDQLPALIAKSGW